VVLTKKLKRVIGAFTDIPWNKEPVGTIFQQKVLDYNTYIFKVDENDILIKMPHKKEMPYETIHFDGFLPSFGGDLYI
jgi:hypothetical protein